MCFLTIPELRAQDSPNNRGYMVKVCVYEGDTIPYITLRNVYVYPKMKFKNKKQERYYYRLVTAYSKGNKKHCNRDIRISGNSPRRKSQRQTYQGCRKRIEGTIHSKNEEIDIFTG